MNKRNKTNACSNPQHSLPPLHPSGAKAQPNKEQKSGWVPCGGWLCSPPLKSTPRHKNGFNSRIPVFLMSPEGITYYSFISPPASPAVMSRSENRKVVSSLHLCFPSVPKENAFFLDGFLATRHFHGSHFIKLPNVIMFYPDIISLSKTSVKLGKHTHTKLWGNLLGSWKSEVSRKGDFSSLLLKRVGGREIKGGRKEGHQGTATGWCKTVTIRKLLLD